MVRRPRAKDLKRDGWTRTRRKEVVRMSFKRDWSCLKCRHIVSNVPTNIQEQVCPVCGGHMEKVWDTPLVMFRGEGWTQKFYNRGEIDG